MAKLAVFSCLLVLFISGTVDGKTCSRTSTRLFGSTYTLYFHCDYCCCGDVDERYCCACTDLYWWIGPVVGSVIGFICFVVFVVIVICILVNHSKKKSTRIIVPGQGPPVTTHHSVTTSSGGYTEHQAFSTGPGYTTSAPY